MRRAFVLAALTLAACSPHSGGASLEPPPAPWKSYACEDGRTFEARYFDSRTADLRLAGVIHHMTVAVSASGARYVGDGLQWWAKGDEGMLAVLQPGEEIAADPGVRCVPPDKLPVPPPQAFHPADASTPRDPSRPAAAPAPGGAQQAATVAETYYALIEAGKTDQASRLRVDGVKEDLARFRTLHAQVGQPERVEGAAGSLYVEVPVVVYGRYSAGGEYYKAGEVVLRRADNVPGASADDLRWRIYRIDLAE